MSQISIKRRSFLAQAALVFALGRFAKAQSKTKSDFVIDGRIIYGDVVTGSESAVVDGPIHDGVEVQIDLPKSQHVKNFAMPPGPNGKGLCVFASMTMAGRWHNIRPLFDVIHKIDEGGGWPEKVDQVIKEFSPRTKIVQYEGTNPAIIDKALAEDRIVCLTYGYGERYGMQTIYHMVCLLHLDDKIACVLDNNYPGTYEWMSRAEFLRRWVHPSGKGWAYVFLAPPPPPIPRNI